MFDFFVTKEIVKGIDNKYYAITIGDERIKATEYAIFRTGCKAFMYRVFKNLKLYQVDVIAKDGKVYSEFITEVED